MKGLQKNAGAVKRFGRLMGFSAWLQNLPARTTPPPFRLIQIGSAFWQSRALHVAARLDIATVLGDATLSVEALATTLGSREDPTYRLLRMLVSMGVFEEPSPRSFRNNKVSAWLRDDRPHSVRAMILMHNSPEMSRPWYEALEAGVRDGGIPFETVHGEELYTYMDHHPEFDALFAGAMDSVEALTGDTFASDFDWSRFQRVIDVGGSKGAKALSILKRHPGLTALVVDRPQVIDEGRAFWNDKEDPALLARLEFATGDVLESVPVARDDGDIYFLCAVFHGFDDEMCVAALKRLAEASAPAGAAIAIMEMVMDERKHDFVSATFDMQMFMGTWGRERTLSQWQALFQRGGVRLEAMVGLRTFAKIMVLRAV